MNDTDDIGSNQSGNPHLAEIIATQLANSMINRGGATLVVRIADQTGASPERIAAAFAAVRNSFELIALNTDIEMLDNLIPAKLQTDLFIAIQDLLLDRIVWFLRNVDLGRGLAAVIEHYRAAVVALGEALERVLPDEPRSRRAAISAAKPAVRHPPSATTSRPVRRTDRTSVSPSSEVARCTCPSEAAAAGFLSLLLPEDRGGSALGLTELCLLAEELGAALSPLPLVHAVAALAALAMGAATEAAGARTHRKGREPEATSSARGAAPGSR